MFRRLLCVLWLSSCACGRASGQSSEPGKPVEPVLGPFRVLSPSEQVPPFRVTATDGTIVDSRSLVGQRPFVVVFFTTWCGVCELKLPLVREVAESSGADVAFVGVPIDDEQTWPEVSDYVGRHGLGFPIVRGQWFPRFALAYDPLQTVPVVAVVGKDGFLVDYQIGWAPGHRQRLLTAVAIAKREASYTGPR